MLKLMSIAEFANVVFTNDNQGILVAIRFGEFSARGVTATSDSCGP